MSRTLLRAWKKTLRLHADARAVTQAADGRSVSFGELDALAEIWRATHAPALHLLAGRAVAFAAPKGIGWFEIFLGLLKAGAIAVPLDAAEPLAAQREIGAALRAAFLWDGTRLNPLPQPRRSRNSAPCLIKLTSGTTGRPRALTFTAAQLLADARHIIATMRLRPRDVNYALIPLGHSYGLGNLTIPLLAHGLPLVCGSAPLPQAIAADFARWQPTVFPGVPSLWRALAGSDVTLPSLRLAISAGAPLAPEIAKDFARRFGRRLHGFYGSSETGGIAYDPTGQSTLAGGIGPALREVKVKILPGQRLLVHSPAVFTHGNRRRVGHCGAWLMSDRVIQANDGRLTLLGRRGTTAKIAGRRVNLAEVAALMRRLPGVHDVWVGVDDRTENLLGAVVAGPWSAAELRAALQPYAPAWKIPKRWRVVASLPLTARGKPDGRALRALLF